MKPLRIAISVLGLLAVVIVGSVAFNRALHTISDPADAFFDLVSQGNRELASQYLASDFSGEDSRMRVWHWLETLELDQTVATEWSHRYRDGNSSGTLEGTVTLADDRKRAVRVSLVNEESRWLISGLSLLNLGESAQELMLPLPDEEQARVLVHRTVQQLAASAQAGDTTELFFASALAFQATHTLDEVNQAFQEVLAMAPVWTRRIHQPPEITKISRHGELELKVEARYRTSDGRVQVRAQYWPQGGEWALSGLNFSMH